MLDRKCIERGEPFTPRRANNTICSKTCRNRRSKRQRNPEGLRADKRRYYLAHPEQYSYEARRESHIKSQRKRRLDQRVKRRGWEADAHVNPDAVAERDQWRCGICRRKVNPRLAWPHPMSRSIDHVIPLAHGGRHEPANCQLAHLSCNSRKHVRSFGEQLRLIG